MVLGQGAGWQRARLRVENAVFVNCRNDLFAEKLVILSVLIIQWKYAFLKYLRHSEIRLITK